MEFCLRQIFRMAFAAVSRHWRVACRFADRTNLSSVGAHFMVLFQLNVLVQVVTPACHRLPNT